MFNIMLRGLGVEQNFKPQRFYDLKSVSYNVFISGEFSIF